MTLKNYTPHTINILNDKNEVIASIPSSGNVTCSMSCLKVGEVDGIPIMKMHFGKPTGLPKKEDRVFLIVSKIVAEAVKDERDDCLVVGETVRDPDGRILGTRYLSRL